MGIYRIEPHACIRGRPQTKGKVERSFYTLEQHLLKGRQFADFADLVAQGEAFDTEGNQGSSSFGTSPGGPFCRGEGGVTTATRTTIRRQRVPRRPRE